MKRWQIAQSELAGIWWTLINHLLPITVAACCCHICCIQAGDISHTCSQRQWEVKLRHNSGTIHSNAQHSPA
jgi:hypothetical protein